MARKSNSPDVHLNLNVRGLKQSATLAINEKSAQLIREGRQVFRLGLGQSPFPVPQPVVDELKANAHQKDYLPVRGLYALREAVAGYHSTASSAAPTTCWWAPAPRNSCSSCSWSTTATW